MSNLTVIPNSYFLRARDVLHKILIPWKVAKSIRGSRHTQVLKIIKQSQSMNLPKQPEKIRTFHLYLKLRCTNKRNRNKINQHGETPKTKTHSPRYRGFKDFSVPTVERFV